MEKSPGGTLAFIAGPLKWALGLSWVLFGLVPKVWATYWEIQLDGYIALYSNQPRIWLPFCWYAGGMESGGEILTVVLGSMLVIALICAYYREQVSFGESNIEL